MSIPVKPGWPDPAALPFNPFGSPPSQSVSQPLTQGLTGGIDLFRQFWGNLPGGAALPGFLVPTLDVEELDKRIKDLRAAESWVEVNLNMLRGTIQGLEVQRNTIAAIQSFSAIADQAMTAQPGAAAALRGVLPAGWPAATPAAVPAATAAAPSDPPAEPPVAAAPPPEPVEALQATPEPGGGLMAGLAANHWLGFMQDQFAKVAQAALARPAGQGEAANEPVAAQRAARKKARKSVAKKAGPRAKVGRKTAGS